MKEKDCKDNEILNPKTKRCVKKDTKNGIEILFNQKDSDILNKYEMIDGKIVKKCEKDKIRNPETKRCIKKKVEEIKKDKTIKKDKSNNLSKKVEAIKKVKKALTPFINRVSAHIYHRNRYLILMRRELKGKKEGCLRVYKENPDKTFSYRIGNRIILKKRIGSDSVYGIVYLSEFREMNKKVFTFASKVYPYMYSRTIMELEILIKLTNVVRMELCPHFPIFYGHVICNTLLHNKKFDIDSFKKTKSLDKTVSQKIRKFPELIKKNSNSIIITTFNELANGDLWKFFELYKKNTNYIINALIQQLLSIMFFNYYTDRIHMDTHPGNFLYHKVKAGGYFHYKIFGIDYYLENIGFLWVIWDFDLSLPKEKAIEKYNIKLNNVIDYNRIIIGYLSRNNSGYNPHKEIDNNATIRNIALDLMINYYTTFKKINFKFDVNNIRDYIYKLPEIISNIMVNGESVFMKSLPKGEKIINKIPYTMNKEELFK
jgi:hypothetical protein